MICAASPTLEADIPDPRACSKLKTATRGMGTSQGTGSARSAPGPENAQVFERRLREHVALRTGGPSAANLTIQFLAHSVQQRKTSAYPCLSMQASGPQ